MADGLKGKFGMAGQLAATHRRRETKPNQTVSFCPYTAPLPPHLLHWNDSLAVRKATYFQMLLLWKIEKRLEVGAKALPFFFF